MAKDKKLSKEQKIAIVEGYRRLVRVDNTLTFRKFCRDNGYTYNQMRYWLRNNNISIANIKNETKASLEHEEAKSNEVSGFARFMPGVKTEMSTEPIDLIGDYADKSDSLYGISIDCPSGLVVKVQECTVDNLAFLMKALQA